MTSTSTSKSAGTKHKYNNGHDNEGRMSSPIAGNPAQRKNQIQSIANDVFTDGMERAPEHPADQLEDGNLQPETAHSPVLHSHTVHDHMTNKSTTHNVPHGHDCPSCGTEYMAAKG